ncbi:hypothetical protein AMECASPLE_010526 [Ameca splendens]|uniref:Secreted protein n=1 Tax=Ameca splendens TaxID=208324 RepID=A0ABV0YYG4_9TELE
MFRAHVRIWLKALHCVFPTKSLLQLPGTCEPKEGSVGVGYRFLSVNGQEAGYTLERRDPQYEHTHS